MVNLAKLYLLRYQGTKIHWISENMFWKIDPQMWPGTSKRAKNSQVGDFKRSSSLGTFFSIVMAENQVVLDFSHVRIPYETNLRP